MLRALLVVLSALPASARGVRRVEINVQSSPQAPALFNVPLTLTSFDYRGLLPEGSLSSLALPASAIADPAAPAAAPLTLRSDDRGFIYFSDVPDEGPASTVPAPEAAADAASERRRPNNNRLGLDTSLEGNTRLTNEPPADAEARAGGPLHENLLALRRQMQPLLEMGEKAGWNSSDLTAAAKAGSLAWEGASKARKPDFTDPGSRHGDLNSIAPFTRALSRYGMKDGDIAMIVARYAKWYEGDSADAYNNRLVGIRAANLMAQQLALHEDWMSRGGSGTRFEHEHPQALILAALIAPTGRSLQNDPYMHQGIQGRPSTKPLYAAVATLVEAGRATDGREIRRLEGDVHRDAGTTLYDYNFQRYYARRMGSLVQFVTRAAMFTGTVEEAQRAVLARAAEMRAADRSTSPTDAEAMIAAAAALTQLVSGQMPFGENMSHFDLAPETSRALVRNYHHFKAAAARLINGGAVRVSYR